MIIKGVGIYGGLVDWLRLFEAGKKFSKLRVLSVPLSVVPNKHPRKPIFPTDTPISHTCRFPCGTKHRTHVLHTCQFPCVQLLRALFETFKRKRQLNITT